MGRTITARRVQDFLLSQRDRTGSCDLQRTHIMAPPPVTPTPPWPVPDTLSPPMPSSLTSGLVPPLELLTPPVSPKMPCTSGCCPLCFSKTRSDREYISIVPIYHPLSISSRIDSKEKGATDHGAMRSFEVDPAKHWSKCCNHLLDTPDSSFVVRWGYVRIVFTSVYISSILPIRLRISTTAASCCYPSVKRCALAKENALKSQSTSSTAGVAASCTPSAVCRA